MSEEIMVSVICTVYNHEKYLRKCLDGFIMQKTNFKFEVLIHDDASTDGSADIIREYEKKYPDIIKPIYQTVNQYSQGIKVSQTYLYPRAKGKYLAFCEGDDYWCDENKLQNQFDVMEKHPSCSICVHDVYDITESNDLIGTKHPVQIKNKRLFNMDEYLDYIFDGAFHPFQTSSYFLKRNIVESDLYKSLNLSPVGDVRIVFTSLALGDLYYINKGMSYYRTNSIGSWSNRVTTDNELWKKHQWGLVHFLDGFNSCTNYKFSQKIYKVKTKKMYYLYFLDDDYRACLNFNNLNYFSSLSLKEKIWIILNAYFPHIMKLYKKSKDKNNA